MKKLLVLGGTLISCEIVRAAHSMGLFVVVSDYNDPKDSPAKQIADESFMVSATDVDGIVELIKREHIDGVITGFADVLLVPYSEICEKAGLPCYGTKEQFELFINKKKYKEKFKEYGIPVISEYSTREIENGDVKFPVLVKPVDNSGARGLQICYTQNELILGIEYAKSNSKSASYIVEPYIEGKECTVFFYFENGKTYLAAIGNRHIKNVKDGVIPLPVGYTYPASVTEKYINDVLPSIIDMFSDLDIRNGMMFIQCKVKEGTCYIYDVGYRLTGSLEYTNFDRVCGYNPLKMLINYAVSGNDSYENGVDRIDPYLNHRYAFNVSCLLRPGIISVITGCEEVRSFPYVDDVILAHLPGDEITEDTVGKLSQIGIRVLGHADTKEDLYNMMSSVHDSLHVISTDGYEMIMPGLSSEDLKGDLF